jgi:hypothetical protein
MNHPCVPTENRRFGTVVNAGPPLSRLTEWTVPARLVPEVEGGCEWR